MPSLAVVPQGLAASGVKALRGIIAVLDGLDMVEERLDGVPGGSVIALELVQKVLQLFAESLLFGLVTAVPVGVDPPGLALDDLCGTLGVTSSLTDSLVGSPVCIRGLVDGVEEGEVGCRRNEGLRILRTDVLVKELPHVRVKGTRVEVIA